MSTTERFTPGENLHYSTSQINVKKYSLHPPKEQRWFGRYDERQMFYVLSSVPVPDSVQQNYQLPKSVSRLFTLDFNVSGAFLDWDTNQTFTTSPFEEDMFELMRFPRAFYPSKMAQDEINHDAYRFALEDNFDVIVGEHQHEREATLPFLYDIISKSVGKNILTVFIHGAPPEHQLENDFLVFSATEGIVSIFELLRNLPAHLSKTHGLNLKNDFSFVNLRMCNRRELAVKQPTDHVLEPMEAFRMYHIDHTEPQIIDVTNKPDCSQIQRSYYSYNSDENIVYKNEEIIRILRNPLDIPLSYALDTVRGYETRGRAFAMPDGKVHIFK